MLWFLEVRKREVEPGGDQMVLPFVKGSWRPLVLLSQGCCMRLWRRGWSSRWPDAVTTTSPGQGHCFWPLLTKGETESHTEGALPRVTDLGSDRSGTRVCALTPTLACLGVGSVTVVSLRSPQKLQRREAREKRPIPEEAAAIGGGGKGNRGNQERRRLRLV